MKFFSNICFVILCAWSLPGRLNASSDSGCKSGNDIYVLGGEASSVWPEAIYVLSNGYTAKGEAETPGSCFYSLGNKDQWALLDICTSDVTQIQLLTNSGEIKGTSVEVCTDGANCQQCGEPTVEMANKEWIGFICGYKGLRGNQIKIIQNDNYLSFCEVRITDKVINKPADQIFITDGTASSEWNIGWAINMGYTKEFATQTPGSCFHSYPNRAHQWAMLDIPDSFVEEVKVLANDAQIEGTAVEVCTDGSDCTQCGDATSLATGGEWAIFTCTPRIRGNQVKVQQTHPTFALLFCEVEISGKSGATSTTTTTTTTTTTPQTTTTTTRKTTTTPVPVCQPEFEQTEGLIKVASCTSMPVKDASRSCNNLFDGSLSRDVKEGKCFATKSTYKAWLELRLDQATTITKLVMLPKGNGDNLAGTIISVCQDNKKNCQRFGKVYKVRADKCIVLKGGPISGNMIRFYVNGSSLTICELKVFGF